jgi:hypothetical protein
MRHLLGWPSHGTTGAGAMQPGWLFRSALQCPPCRKARIANTASLSRSRAEGQKVRVSVTV